ncbi:NfeD family protein [Colwellia sp. MEBiC06753]
MEFLLNNLGESLMSFGILALILEVAIFGMSSFILTFVGLAAVLCGVLVLLGILPETFVMVSLALALSSTLFAFILWKPLKNFQNKNITQEVSNDFIGLTFILNDDIDALNSSTHKLSGVDWKVIANEPIAKGTEVKVTHASVGVLKVVAI